MKYSILALLLHLSILGFNQDNHFGIKGGYILSNQQDGLENIKYKSLSSFQIGVLYSINISKKISLIPELLYSNKGTKINDSKLILRTFEVPLLMSYKIKSFALELGPQYSQIFKAKWVDEIEIYKENFSMSNIGFVIGLNYSISDRLLLGSRFQKDITNNLSLLDYFPKTISINNGSEDPSIPAGFPVSKTQAFQIFFTYTI